MCGASTEQAASTHHSKAFRSSVGQVIEPSQNWTGLNDAFWRDPAAEGARQRGGDGVGVRRDERGLPGPGTTPSLPVYDRDEKTAGRVCGSAPTVVETDSRQVTPKHQGKPGIIRDQRTRPVNKIDNLAKSAKPPSPVQIRAAPPIQTFSDQ